jgi:hypothetical protein
MIEIVPVVVNHADSLHHPPRPMIPRHRERHDFGQAKLLVSLRLFNRAQGRFGTLGHASTLHDETHAL